MLFSRDNVAKFVNDNYEATWESVRPVPIIKIDFGNGNVITRTLHGNIATYVCQSDGSVIDVIPGIYAPDVYVQRLNELRLLAGYVRALTPEKGAEFVKNYHADEGKAKAVALPARLLDVRKSVDIEGPVRAVVEATKPVPAPPAAQAAVRAAFPPNGAAPMPPNGAAPVVVRRDVGKSRIERPVEGIIAARMRAQLRTEEARAAAEKAATGLTSAEDLASWELLREDTQGNETVRRKQIHAMLAKLGSVKPAEITKALYKDVLHADLDDPYLGLGPTLFGSYPFAKEDSARK